MSRELIVRSVAEAELAEAFDWYEDRVTGLGSDFLLSVDAVLNAIARNPQQYQIIHKTIHRALTKRFPYEILFIVEEKRIVVLAIFHAKRDPRHWQDRS